MKTTLHTFRITGTLSRVYIQIRLPRNHRQISAIGVTNTADFFAASHRICGLLNLWSSASAEPFFSEQIDTPKQQHKNEFLNTFDTYSLGTGEYWTNASKRTFLKTNIRLQNPLIEGYFENVIPLNTGSYSVTIYLQSHD